MKKLNKNHIVLLSFILLFFTSCVDKEGKYTYYQVRNKSGEDLKLIFYYTNRITPPENYDSFILKNEDYSISFSERKGGYNDYLFFISSTDSIDIVANNVLKKRYKRSDNFTIKTLYNTKFYDTIKIGSKGETIYVYTILIEDF